MTHDPRASATATQAASAIPSPADQPALPDLHQTPGAISLSKRLIPVPVQFASSDGVCATLEGDVPYRRGDAILTGMVGERWPVARARFDERYVPAPGTAAGQDGAYIKRPSTVLALRLSTPLAVRLPDGGTLQGNPGDWLLQYAPGDYGVVRDDIFRGTYEGVGDR